MTLDRHYRHRGEPAGGRGVELEAEALSRDRGSPAGSRRDRGGPAGSHQDRTRLRREAAVYRCDGRQAPDGHYIESTWELNALRYICSCGFMQCSGALRRSGEEALRNFAVAIIFATRQMVYVKHLK